MTASRCAAALAAALALSAALVGATAHAAPTPAAGPSGQPWVASVGDSFIAGEAGRWAGNQSGSTDDIDALGSSAYWDAEGGEAIEFCHRSRSAPIHIGVVRSVNLACSGALTSTHFDDGAFKPGIDFYSKDGRKGQALMLQEFAADHRVRMVGLSIGGNDFGFESIITQCVTDFLRPWPFSAQCRNSAEVQRALSPQRVDAVRADIREAILNVATAMERAGYADAEWTLVLQLYPRPLPSSDRVRYPQFGYGRQVVGGCGFTDDDLDWAAGPLVETINGTVTAAAADARERRPGLQVEAMDPSRAFEERQLCHDEVWRVRERGSLGALRGPSSWRDADAVDRSEWVSEINVVNLGETYQEESLHPNYWGQLALRNCWRQVWNSGDVRGGTCTRGPGAGLTEDCEPRMTFVAGDPSSRGVVTPRAAPAVAQRDAEVSLRCPGITVRAGSTAVLRGRVTPVGGGGEVLLQASLDGGSWRDRARAVPGPDGDFRFTQRIPRSAPEGRTYRWRVVALSGSDVLAVSVVRSASVRGR